MIKGINHITLAVNDVNKSFRFYTTILNLKPIAKWDQGAYLTAGDTWIALNKDPKVSKTKRSDYSHIAFTCYESDFNSLKSKLLANNCKEWSKNKSEGNSFYFVDPDGHRCEIHVGDLQSRLTELHKKPWSKIEFFDKST